MVVDLLRDLCLFAHRRVRSRLFSADEVAFRHLVCRRNFFSSGTQGIFISYRPWFSSPLACIDPSSAFRFYRPFHYGSKPQFDLSKRDAPILEQILFYERVHRSQHRATWAHKQYARIRELHALPRFRLLRTAFHF